MRWQPLTIRSSLIRPGPSSFRMMSERWRTQVASTSPDACASNSCGESKVTPEGSHAPSRLPMAHNSLGTNAVASKCVNWKPRKILAITFLILCSFFWQSGNMNWLSGIHKEYFMYALSNTLYLLYFVYIYTYFIYKSLLYM